MEQLFKILITDTVDRTNTKMMMVDSFPKIFNSLEEANSFCDFVNAVAKEENATWRYESSLLTEREQAALRAFMLRDMF